MQTIKWLLFHEPAELFIRTAEHFQEEVSKRTGESWDFEILLLDDYERLYCNGNACDPIEELRTGRVQMSQLYTQSLAFSNVSDFMALGLPFLFRDHDHASRVFDGEVGEELLAQLTDKLNIKGLSFTYSGGYKVMACDTPIRSLDDFKSLKYRNQRSGVFTEIFKTLGATPTTREEANLCQTTLPRYHADAKTTQRWCTDTGHSMYLTSILMNDDLWNSFDETTRTHFKAAAKTCAQAERVQSVADANEIATNSELQNSRGIDEIIHLSSEDQRAFETMLTPIIDKWKPYFTPGLVDRIQAA